MPGFGREPCHYSTVSSQTTAVPVGGVQLPQGWSKFSSCSRLASRLFAIWNGHRTLLRPNSCAPPRHRCLLRILPANFRLRFRPSRGEPVATGRIELLQEPPFRRRWLRTFADVRLGAAPDSDRAALSRELGSLYFLLRQRPLAFDLIAVREGTTDPPRLGANCFL